MSSKKKGTRGATKKTKYKDEHVSDDEEFVQTFDVEEKLRSKDFPRFFTKELTGSEVVTCLYNVLIYSFWTASQTNDVHYDHIIDFKLWLGSLRIPPDPFLRFGRSALCLNLNLVLK